MQAISNIHSRFILHNDISDGNLLFDEYLNPVCIDFGLARRFEIHGEHHLELLCLAQTGTPYYASYEALRFRMPSGILQGYTSTKGDVYAATAVLFDDIFCRDPSLPVNCGNTELPVPWERRLSIVFEALDQNDLRRFALSLYRQCLQYDPLMRASAATAVQNAQQFVSILLPPAASEALNQVLDGTLKRYPWELLFRFR